MIIFKISIFILRSSSFYDFTGLCGIITKTFLICTRKILTSENSESWTNKKSLSASIGTSLLNQNEYQRIPDLNFRDFDNCLTSFKNDLQTISKTKAMKVVLLIDEAQVKLFFLLFIGFFLIYKSM